MFDSLRDRLQGVQQKLGLSIKKAEEMASEPLAPVKTPAPEKTPKKSGGKLVDKVKVFIRDRELVLTEKDIADSLEELELILLENDVALSAVDAIVGTIRHDLTGTHRKIGSSIDAVVVGTLKHALRDVLGEGFDLIGYIDSHDRPVRVLFTGVNGTGKTTTVAKVAAYLKGHGYSVVIGSGDTFRAGANEQMKTHADRVGVKVIRHQHGGDPSAVLFDAVEYARAHNIDVVLADTAGRFHNRANLMNQLEKIRRVMKPDLVVYVDEAVAGNDAVIRADQFNAAVGTDAVVLTKADMDTKGGAAISIVHTIGKPIMFLGVGQGYEDIIPFSPDRIVDDLVGESG
jgi:fused signal recognition particle receptor